MAKNEFQNFIEHERKLSDKRYSGQPVNERNKKPSPKKPLPAKPVPPVAKKPLPRGPQGPQGPKSPPRKGDDGLYRSQPMPPGWREKPKSLPRKGDDKVSTMPIGNKPSRKGDDMAYIQPYPYRQPANTKREMEAGLIMKSSGKKK